MLPSTCTIRARDGSGVGTRRAVGVCAAMPTTLTETAAICCSSGGSEQTSERDSEERQVQHSALSSAALFSKERYVDGINMPSAPFFCAARVAPW